MNNRFEYCIVTPGTQAYREYLALRYKVFCEELKRVPCTGQFFSKVPLESDVYDIHSLHVLCSSMETGASVGCARLILPNAKGLSISSRYNISHQTAISPMQIGEVGRFAIASELRRYRGKLSGTALQNQASQNLHPAMMNKQDGPIVALGLFRKVFKLAYEHGITHCYAAMEPSLARLLTRVGFPLQMMGPINTMVKPPRQPYFIWANSVRSVLLNYDIDLPQFLFMAPKEDEPVFAAGELHTHWTPTPLQNRLLEHSGQYPVFSQ